MAANLGQAFLGGPGIVPTLAQELASGSFQESRESFHDYIYSKLILGEDKGGSANAGNTSNASPNHPVFPNTNLSNSYPNPAPSTPSPYGHSQTNQAIGETASGSRVFVASSPPTGSPPTQKAGSSKKKLAQPFQNTQPQGSPVTGQTPTKVKKKSHHKKKEKTNVCDVCGRGFAEKYTLNRHMLTHTHIKPYSCTKCNMAFSRSDGLAKHMAAGHRRIDAHHCDVCGGTFNSEVSFEQHRREYGNTLPFVCNLCMLAFSQCCHLNYHMKSHSLSKLNDSLGSEGQEDKNNAIDVSELIPEDFSPPRKDSQKDSSSSYLYNPNSNLSGMNKSGEERRNGENSLSLLDPNIVIKPEIEDIPPINNQLPDNTGNSSSFDALSNLPSSTLVSQPGNSKNMNSSITTSSPSYLPNTSSGPGSSALGSTNPLSDIDMKKYFDIKIPNPKFMGSMEVQAQGTGEDGLFRCQLCGKGFTRKYHMQRHVKLHTRGPVPKAHLLDWTRRPYACGVCKMGFTRQHHLTRHMLIHTGERPHSCHVCGKAFRRFTNLSLHVRTVHGAERPFKCSICGRGFPRLYSLQRHLKLHAKNAATVGSDNVEHLYTGFKAVGTMNIDHSDGGKSPSYNMANPGDGRQSPQSPESISSEHSDEDSERFEHDSSAHEHDSSAHEDTVGQVDSAGRSSPMPKTNSYTELQDRNRSQGFHPSNVQLNQVNDQHSSLTRGPDTSLLSQHAGRLSQPSAMTPQDTEALDQQSQRLSVLGGDSMARLANDGVGHQGRNDGIGHQGRNDGIGHQGRNDGIGHQGRNDGIGHQGRNDGIGHQGRNDGIGHQGRNDSIGHQSRNDGIGHQGRNDGIGHQGRNEGIGHHSRNVTDFSPHTALQNNNNNNEGFNPTSSIPSQSISNMDLPVVSQGNFTEMNLRDAGNFALSQRTGGEGFSIHPQRIQTSHLLLNTLERPGSRSMMSQSSTPDFHHSQASYNRQQQPTQQQLASMDLSSSRNTMSPAMSSRNTASPATIRDTISFNASHRVDMGSSRSRISDPPAYSHSHSVNALQFATGGHAHGLYQQQLSDNISQLEMHPHTSPSPMPVNSHTNSMQY